ncbi:MAG: F0F1 ATP synthase subunit delta [Candidatus Vogelbacteria bacterium]|nr:F0F1 ATP synthase subunit delta [Candidatus Vogelbacteria bacterium]
MKYSPTVYSRALVSAVEEESRLHAGTLEVKKLTHNFVRLLEKNGDVKKIENIVDAIERVVVRARGGRLITVIMPRKFSARLLSNIKESFPPEDKLIVKIDERIISGVKIIFDDEEIIDNSLATALKRMFI